MALILDADSLIKLNRVGALDLVARAFECVIPTAVYQEAVVNARARGYPDAESIDNIVRELIPVQEVTPSEPSTTFTPFGPGEGEVLALATQGHGESIIVSDDLVFLNAVRRTGIRYVTPIALIPRLARIEAISVDGARELLERSRRLTNERNYLAALADLEVYENDDP